MASLVDTSEFIETKKLRPLYRLIQPLSDRILGFNRLNDTYNKIKSQGISTAIEFCDASCAILDTTVEVDPALREALSVEGPIILVANHPYGCIDSIATMQLVDQCRNGKWLIVANRLLRNVEALGKNVISVNPFAKGKEKRENLMAVKAMHKVLARKETLVMFPAARVSGWNEDIQQVCDLPWSAHPVKLATRYQATIIFCHISGQNSDTFLKIDPIQLKRRSIRLAKEVFIQRHTTVQLKLSSIMSSTLAEKVNRLPNKEEILLAHTYIGADKSQAKPNPQLKPNELPKTTSSVNYHEVLSNSQTTILEHPEFHSFCFKGADEPEVMQEIGRLRNITFSLIGAGSGKEIDLSPEDDYYHHIVVTEVSSGKIAGAYRLGFSQEIIAKHGVNGLYLNHIFTIDSAFYQSIGNALELSRSFVPPEFQRSSQVLDLLWKSLGRVATQNNCSVLYGSVTVSAEFTPLSQAVIIDTLDRHHSADAETRSLIKNSKPFKPATRYHQLLADAYAPHGLNRLNAVIEEIEEGHRSIPPLARYYSTLGAKFLSFKVEPSFNDAVYCLLMVELDKIPKRYQKRFLGR